jgi:hypothetical protein
MSQYPGYRPPGPQGAPQFSPPGSNPNASGHAGHPYGGPPQPTAPPWPAQQLPAHQWPAQQLPVPPWPGQPQPYAPALRPQRPAVIAMAATMTVTASLQWLCALSLAWLVATAGASGLSSANAEAPLFHILRRFHLRMIEGLALPLYAFPTLAFFLGFVILAPRLWARLALTLTGVAALAWSAWWLRGDILWWLPIATYIAVVCLVLWTPGATQWYRRRTI